MARQWIKDIKDWNGEGVLSVLGPTGSGKTQLVLDWIEKNKTKFKADPLLVSVDSIAVYRDMDIGSAKPLGPDRTCYNWFGLDMISPDKTLTSTEFAEGAWTAIEAAQKENRPVILVGGSHFYERVLVDGPAPGAGSDPAFLKTLENVSNQKLFDDLCKIDSRWATTLHVNDRYRLERFYDLVQRQKMTYDELKGAGSQDKGLAKKGTVYCLAFGMDLSPEEVHERLKVRLAQMLKSGWIEETKKILESHGEKAPGLASVGYREITSFLTGGLTENQYRDRILTSHHQLAKKQRTWIRGLVRKEAT